MKKLLAIFRKKKQTGIKVGDCITPKDSHFINVAEMAKKVHRELK